MDWAVQQISIVFNKQSMHDQSSINTKINTISTARNQEIGQELKSVPSYQLNISKDEMPMAKCIELIMILNLTIPLHDLAKLCFLIQSEEDKKSSEYHQEFNSTDIIYRYVIGGLPIDLAKTEFDKFDDWSMQ